MLVGTCAQRLRSMSLPAKTLLFQSLACTCCPSLACPRNNSLPAVACYMLHTCHEPMRGGTEAALQAQFQASCRLWRELK